MFRHVHCFLEAIFATLLLPIAKIGSTLGQSCATWPNPILFHSQSNDMNFQMEHWQFPLCLAFAMTINKSQGGQFGTLGLI
jgi:hypothetical protein